MEEDARADIQQLIRRKKQTKLKLKSGVSNLIDAVIIPRQIRVEEFEIKGAKRRHVMLVAGAINAITGRKDWQVVERAQLMVFHIHVAVNRINSVNE